MKRALLATISCLLLPVSQFAVAAETTAPLVHAPVDHYDFDSMQRGAKLFVDYCMGCHSLKYVRYSRLVDDLGIPDQIAQANLARGGKLFAPMVSSMETEQARRWFNQAVPPDLSVVARSRGADWLYGFLRSFYLDPETSTGWNNELFANTAMPNVLHSLQGVYVHDDTGARIAVSEGKLEVAQFDTAVADLVNFMVYASEPVRNTRVRIGFGVMIFLSVLLGIVYMMYREYWKDIK